MKDQCLLAFETRLLLTRPTSGRTSQKHKRTLHSEGSRPPNAASTRQLYLREGIDASDLATVKDFLRFYVATSCGGITEKPTPDLINTFAEIEAWGHR